MTKAFRRLEKWFCEIDKGISAGGKMVLRNYKGISEVGKNAIANLTKSFRRLEIAIVNLTKAFRRLEKWDCEFEVISCC